MPAAEHWALWVNRHGQKCWNGPFETEGRAWGSLQQIIDVQKAFVISGTQMSNTVPPAPAVSEFAQAQPAPAADPDTGYGPWFTASYDSDCDGICGGRIYEGEQSRSDGDGGWLCSFCGKQA
jgi:hypothetical protein